MYVCEVFKGEKRKEQAASSGPQTEAVSVKNLLAHRKAVQRVWDEPHTLPVS